MVYCIVLVSAVHQREPQVYIYPLTLERPSHLPPHSLLPFKWTFKFQSSHTQFFLLTSSTFITMNQYLYIILLTRICTLFRLLCFILMSFFRPRVHYIQSLCPLSFLLAVPSPQTPCLMILTVLELLSGVLRTVIQSRFI